MVGLATGVLYFFDNAGQHLVGWSAFLLVLLIALVAIYFDIVTTNKQITTISSIYFGLLMGLLLGSLFSWALEPILQAYFANRDFLIQSSRLLITLLSCYISVSLLFQTKDEFRFIIPYVEFSKQVKGGRPLVLDTSVIIDGRIADICETGVIDTKLVIPRFVLQELQGIADSSDKIKRNRGRRGLDILKRLQSNTKIDFQMHEGSLSGGGKDGAKDD